MIHLYVHLFVLYILNSEVMLDILSPSLLCRNNDVALVQHQVEGSSYLRGRSAGHCWRKQRLAKMDCQEEYGGKYGLVTIRVATIGCNF